MDACIILAHGSVRKETNEVMNQIRSLLEADLTDPNIELSIAYLQLAEPNLSNEVRRLYQLGYKHIGLIPMFIFDGVHVTQDIPEVCRKLEAEMTDLNLVQGDHIGADPLLAQIVRKRINQLISKN